MSRLRDIRIGNKLTLIQLFTALAVILFCSAIFYWTALNHYQERQLADLEYIAQVLANTNEAALLFEKPEVAKADLSYLKNNKSILNATILNSSGEIFAEYTKVGEDYIEFEEPIKDVKVFYERNRDYLYYYRKAYARNQKTLAGTICLRTNNDELNILFYGYLKAMVWCVLGGLILSLILASAFKGMISKPLDNLLRSVTRIVNRKNYSAQLPVAGKDEISSLAIAFNKILGQLQQKSAIQNIPQAPPPISDNLISKQEMEDTITLKTRSLIEESEELTMRLKRLEQSQRQLETSYKKLENTSQELEQFANTAANDMRTPLKGINQKIGQLYQQIAPQLDEQSRKSVQDIAKDTKKLDYYVEDLQLYSSIKAIEPSKQQLIKLNELLLKIKANLAKALAKSNGILTADDLPVVKGDKNQLGLLFQSLISNAFKFRSPKRDPEIHISVNEFPEYWQFAVIDNGNGIKIEDPEVLFDLKKQSNAVKMSGIGMNLAICKKIVEVYNGKIWFESEPGYGSTFYFTIPKQEDEED